MFPENFLIKVYRRMAQLAAETYECRTKPEAWKRL